MVDRSREASSNGLQGAQSSSTSQCLIDIESQPARSHGWDQKFRRGKTIETTDEFIAMEERKVKLYEANATLSQPIRSEMICLHELPR